MNQKMVLTILLFNLFLAFLGIGIVIPILPTIMNELSISGSTAANMVAAFSLTQLLASPLAGKWVDLYGRKKIVVSGLIIFGLSEFLFAIGNDVEILFLSRLLGGVSGAFIMPAVTAFIADITTLEERPKGMGYMSVAISTGFIIGPGIGGFLAMFGTRVPFYVASLLAIFAAILSLALLKEPQRIEESTCQNEGKVKISTIFEQRYFIALIIIFISSFGLASIESLFSLFVDKKFQFTSKDIAILVTGSGLLGAITQLLLFERLTKKIGEIALIRYSLLLSATFAFIMTVINAYWMILLTTCILFVGFDLIRPALSTYLSKVAGNEQGFVGGMNSTFSSLGYIVGPIIGGILYDVQLNYPFYLSACIILTGFLLALFWKKPSISKDN